MADNVEAVWSESALFARQGNLCFIKMRVDMSNSYTLSDNFEVEWIHSQGRKI